MLKFCLSTTFALASLLSAIPARAQYMSMFNAANMSAVNIAGTASVNASIGHAAGISGRNTGQTQTSTSSEEVPPSPESDISYQAIRFSEDPSIRAEIIATYVDRVRQVNASDGDRLEALFRSRDLIGEFAHNATAYGLDTSEFGDVVTAFWAVSWGAVHQSGRPSIEQVQGLRKQFRSVLAGSQLVANTTPVERQRMADDMIVKLILIDGAVEEGLRTGNTEQLRVMSRTVQQTTLNDMGVDLAALNLTEKGLALP